MAAIRDLIVVSRTVIDAQQETDKQIKQLDSDLKAGLERLVQNIEALLKCLHKPNGNQ